MTASSDEEYYFKKLGLKSKKKVLESFEDEGLGDLLTFNEPEVLEEPTPQPTTPSSTKYTPPQSRSKSLSSIIQGQLNKLSAINLAQITSTIQLLLDNHPRNDVTSLLISTILTQVSPSSDQIVIESFISVCAGLVASLSLVIGVEFSAKMVTRIVELTDPFISNNSNNTDDKPINLVTTLCYLYNFNVVSSVIIYNLLDILILDLNLNIDLLSKIIKVSGENLKSNDPHRFKDLFISIFDSSSRIPDKSSRLQFALDTITDLKNNNKRKRVGADGEASRLIFEKIDIYLKNLSKECTYSVPLNASWSEIKSSGENGRWWLVGAAWKGNQDDIKQVSKTSIQKDNLDLLSLARINGMNTDIRQKIFITIMSASDFENALSLIQKLSLTTKQSREVPRVLIYCCMNEPTYNHYYTLLLMTLITSKTDQVTIQYCIWDKIKSFSIENTVSIRKINNLSRLIVKLIPTLSISLFKILTFTELNDSLILLCQLVFKGIFLDECDVSLVFGKANCKDANLFKDGILFFLNTYCLDLINDPVFGFDKEKAGKFREFVDQIERVFKAF